MNGRDRTLFRVVTVGAAMFGAFAVWAEVAHWRSSKRMLGAGASSQGTEAVVVLGYGNRGERANFVNRYRVRAGIRSIDRAADSVLVLCGGTVEGDIPEAVIMERYAREELGYTGRIVREPQSRSTWQNIENAIPLIEHAGVIRVVSNSPHAEVAREYLWQQRPDLAERLVRADEHRFGEIIPMKIGATLRALLFRWQQRPRSGINAAESAAWESTELTDASS